MDQIILSRKDLAELFGYKNEGYINELEKDYGLPKVDWNKYELSACLKWFLQYKEEIHQKEIEKTKAAKPQDDLARKNAQLKQLEIEEKTGLLIDADLVRNAWLNEVTIFVSALDTILADAQIQIKHPETIEILRNIITKRREAIAALKLNLQLNEVEGE